MEPEHSEESGEPEEQETSLNEPLPSGGAAPSAVADIVGRGEPRSGEALA